MQFFVIERYKDRDAKAVYRLFEEKGRQMPDGLTCIESWIEANFDRCFMVVECDDARLLQEWVLAWRHLVEFEFIPVVRSQDTVATVAPLL